MVGIDGGRLHVRCVGSGATTVLLIAGLESADGSWEEIEPAISQENRVCSYARFGTFRLVPVDNTSHHIEIDRPDVVITEIARLLP